MGWKGTIKSISAASNRAAREEERLSRKLEREEEKIRKKLAKLDDSKEKIENALKSDYASGKIDNEKYQGLLGRSTDISDELIVFGKSAGITLGKRYVCGKIGKEEFEKISLELIPADLDKEKDLIIGQIGRLQKDLGEFKRSCSDSLTHCQKCSMQKGVFRPLRKFDKLILCGKCLSEYKAIKNYNGFEGVYLIADPCEVLGDMALIIRIQSDWL